MINALHRFCVRLENAAGNATRRSAIKRYAFSSLCVLVATLLRFLLQPVLGNAVPWILFYPSVALAAWFGGFKGGMVAMLMSIVVADFFWIEPFYSLAIRNQRSVVIILLYAGSSTFISYLAELWHRSQQQLRLATEKIEQHAAELEKNVQERTARLQETVAELESFSYTISHDLRAPLRAMQNFSQFVIEDSAGKLEPASIEYLDRIKKAANRMDRLINDVLIYSRTAREELQFRPVDLDELVKDISKEYRK